MRPIGGPAHDIVGSRMPGEASGLTPGCRDEIDVGVASVLAGEGDPAAVGRELGEQLHALVGRQLSRRSTARRHDPQVAAVNEGDPVLVNVGWARFGDNIGKTEGDWTPFKNGDDVNFFAGSVQYIQEQFLVGFNLGWMNTKSGFFASYPSAKGTTTGTPTRKDDLNLLILSLDFNWNADFWSVYATGLMNAGKDEGFTQTDTGDITGNVIEDEIKYGGFLLAAGGKAQFDQWGVGLDFYMASGDDDSTDDKYENPIVINPGSSLGVYNMDAIVMPGWFDDENSAVTTGKSSYWLWNSSRRRYRQTGQRSPSIETFRIFSICSRRW